jgi:3D (Asp-Asp-Asp) domain-containing protein
MPNNKIPKGIILYALSMVVVSVSVFVYGCIREESTNHYVGSLTIASDLLENPNNEEMKREELKLDELPLERKLKEDQRKERLVAAKKAIEKKKKEEAERKRKEEERRKAEKAKKREEMKREEDEENRKQAAKVKTDETKPKTTSTSTFVATAYTAYCNTGCIGVTRTGIDVSDTTHYKGRRIVATSPSQIPMYSEMTIHYNGGSFEAIAADTGQDITQNRIDVLVSDKDKAWNFGRQEVQVEITKWGE